MKKIIILLFATMLISCGGAGENTPEGVAEQFLTHMAKEDHKALLALTAEGQREQFRTDIEQGKAFIKEIEQNLRSEEEREAFRQLQKERRERTLSFELQNKEQGPDSASVLFRVTNTSVSGMTATETIAVKLTMENGVWRVVEVIPEGVEQ